MDYDSEPKPEIKASAAHRCFPDFCIERSVSYNFVEAEKFFKVKSQQILDYMVGSDVKFGCRILCEMYTQRDHASLPPVLAILREDIKDFLDEIVCERFGPLVKHCYDKLPESCLQHHLGKPALVKDIGDLLLQKDFSQVSRRAAASILGFAMVVGDEVADNVLQSIQLPVMRIAI